MNLCSISSFSDLMPLSAGQHNLCFPKMLQITVLGEKSIFKVWLCLGKDHSLGRNKYIIKVREASGFDLNLLI